VWSPDSELALTTSYDKTAKLWSVGERCRDRLNGETRLLHTFEGHGEVLRAAAFANHGEWCATASADGTARIWDVFGSYGGGCLRILGPREALGFVPGEHRSGHHGCIFSISFDITGNLLLTGSIDHTARLWNVISGECLQEFVGHSAMVTCCKISPDSAFALTASGDFTAKVWDLETGECKFTLEGHTRTVTSCAFSADCESIVTTSEDTVAKTWGTARGVLFRTLQGHTKQVNLGVFSLW